MTLCWKIPKEANTTQLKYFTIQALKRPVQQEMQKVASARKDGRFLKAYDNHHDGVYKGRVIVHADLQARLLFLKISNYSRKMENVYCALYNMSEIIDLPTCHSDALFLRNSVGKFCCNWLVMRLQYLQEGRGGGGGCGGKTSVY